MSEKGENTEVKRPPPLRRSDVIERRWEKAITWAVLGVLALIIGLLLFSYNDKWFAFEKMNFEGLDIRVASYPFLAIGALMLLYAGSRVVGGKKVKSYLSTCPHCGHDSEFAEEPQADYICEECTRRVPIKDGKVLDVTGVRIAMASSFMSIIPAEILAADSGIGFLLQNSSILLQTNRIFVALLTICVLGFIFDRLFRMAVDRMLSRYMSYIALT
jgi:hypothetical protein